MNIFTNNNSKYLWHWVKQPRYKRILRWLYKRFINEPYFPEGKIEFYIKEKGCMANEPVNSLSISYQPNRWIPGMLEDYFFDGVDCEITICKK